MTALAERARADGLAVGEPVPSARLRVVDVLRLALLLLGVANLGRLPVLDTGGREAPILLNDVAVGATLLCGVAASLAARRFVLDRVALLGLLFAAVGVGSALLAVRTHGLTGFELGVSLAYLARWLFYFGVYVVVVNVARREDAPRVWDVLELTILGFAAFGILQATLLPNFAQILFPQSRAVVDWDIQEHRLVSTLLDPNFAGMLILVGLLVQLARLAAGVPVAAWRPTLLFLALLLTVSRSSALALLAGGFLILRVRGMSRQVVRALLAASVLLLLALPVLLLYAKAYNKLTIDASALARVVMWARGIQVWLDHPVWGIGFNTWGFVQERYGWERLGAATYSIEGGLLFVGVMTGIVGLGVYLLMLRAVLRRCRAVWCDTAARPDERALATGTAAVTVALLVHSCFTNSLFLPFIMEPLWVLWGLVAVLARNAGRANAHLDTPALAPARPAPRTPHPALHP